MIKTDHIIALSLLLLMGITFREEAHELAPNMKFHQSKPTIEAIKQLIKNKQKGVYLRLGDGEINIAIGGPSMDQIALAGSQMAQEMREAFTLNGPGILKSLPLNCKEFGGLEPGMFEGVHYWPYEFCKDYITKAKRLWGKEVEDVYSQVAMHHLFINDTDYCINFFKFLKQSNCTLFVGNQNIPAHVRSALFGNQCHFVPTPPRDAYQHIDTLEKQCLEKLNQTKEYQVAIVTAGPTGIILQKRLWNKVNNVFLFNLGSVIDYLCGWYNTRAWIELTRSKVDRNAFLKRLS